MYADDTRRRARVHLTVFFFHFFSVFFFVFSIHRSRIWWFPLLWRRDESDDEGSKEGSFSSSGKNIYIYKDKEMMMEKKEEKEGDGFWSSLAFGWESTQCDWYSNQLRQFHRHDSKWRGPGRGWCGNVIPIRLLYMYMWRREEKKKKKEKKESEKRMKKKIEEGEKETHREREKVLIGCLGVVVGGVVGGERSGLLPQIDYSSWTIAF